MSIFRKHSWTDLAEADQHVTVFVGLDEALGSSLGDFAPSSLITYTINAENGSSVYPTSRDQVSDAMDSLGGKATWLAVSYTRSTPSQEPSRSVRFFTQPLAAFTEPLGIKERISCCLMVFGNDESEIDGLFESLCTRLDEEIKREWPKSNAETQEVAPPAVTGPQRHPA
jgi:hypothetical protein